jgi:streptogramin lyase
MCSNLSSWYLNWKSLFLGETAMNVKEVIWRLVLVVAICLSLPEVAKGQELVVTSFFSNKISRFGASAGNFIGDYEAGGVAGPLCAKIGPDGLMYVTSEGTNQVKRFNWQTGQFVDNFVVGGAEGMNTPTGLVWDQDGNLLVGSFNRDAVYRFNGQTGAYLNVAVNNQQGGLNGPDNGMTLGPDGALYVPSYFSNQIIRYDLTTGTSNVFVNSIGRPRVLVFEGDHLFVTSETADAVLRYDLQGNFVDRFIDPGSNLLDEPIALAHFGGQWLVGSGTLDRILSFDAQGNLLNANFLSGSSINGPTFIAVAIPEPSSCGLLASATLILGCLRRFRRPCNA